MNESKKLEIEQLIEDLGEFIGTVLDEEWEWMVTGRDDPPSRCLGGNCVWGGSDVHEPDCIITKVREKGFALIPLKIYFISNGKAKLALGLAKGKKLYDKRVSLKKKESDRDMERAVRKYK